MPGHFKKTTEPIKARTTNNKQSYRPVAKLFKLNVTITSTGAVGPRGMTGLKGDPGESISLPAAIVSPNTQTVRENQSATFYCSASGNPKPTVTWTKVKGLFNKVQGRSYKNHEGTLEIIRSTYNDSGEYKCTAVSVLGRDEKIANLIVEGE